MSSTVRRWSVSSARLVGCKHITLLSGWRTEIGLPSIAFHQCVIPKPKPSNCTPFVCKINCLLFFLSYFGFLFLPFRSFLLVLSFNCFKISLAKLKQLLSHCCRAEWSTTLAVCPINWSITSVPLGTVMISDLVMSFRYL